MKKINIDTKNITIPSVENELEEILENTKINNELKETLEKADLTLKLSLKDEDTLIIEKIEKLQEPLEKENQEELNKANFVKKNIAETKMESNKNVLENLPSMKESKFKKIIKSSYKVLEEFIDSMARKLLKEKFKWNYSVYNDGKKAYKAIKEKDVKTFLQKGTDSILYMFKKIPASTKKVIKNTKNVAIDEIFSWNEV